VSGRLAWPDGTIYTITRSSGDTDGALFEMEWQLPAGAWSPQPHVHPHLTEEYEVLDGGLELLINRSWRRLRPGDRATVAAGTVHTFRVGTAPARVRNVHRPACDFEPYIRALCATANASPSRWPTFSSVAGRCPWPGRLLRVPHRRTKPHLASTRMLAVLCSATRA
jgi:mannose-6-phosphate isomerase-like protein (cupin superfamily)